MRVCEIMSHMVSKNGKAIENMFSAIAPRYDFLNHFLSAGIDRRWRKQGIETLAPGRGFYLDIACGTGDLALELRRQSREARIAAVDFSSEMLKIGHLKTAGKKIAIIRGDALSLGFRNSAFDGITCAFGIRNFENLESGLKEMLRVLKPGGKAMILEFTTPSNRLVRAVYLLYFTKILPLIGKIVSGHSEAYDYLPQSAVTFPNRAKLVRIFDDCGFEDVSAKPLTFGICDLICAKKPSS